VAHAEASARTIEAAVTTAAAQLGLRADQVDVEILEEPVPSTFGYIGSPARIRVTPRAGSGPEGEEGAGRTGERGDSTVEGGEAAAAATHGSGPVAGSEPVSATGVGSESVAVAAAGMESASGLAAGSDSNLDATGGTASASSAGSAPVPSRGADPVPSTGTTEVPSPASGSGATPATGSPPPGPAADPTPTGGQPALLGQNWPDRSHSSDPSNDADSPSEPVAGTEQATNLESGELAPSGAAQATEVAASPSAQPSSTTARGSNGDRGMEGDSAATPSPHLASSSAPASSSESAGTPRPSRRNYRDEPLDPAAIEADTERAGDFLEGLLDALDVDGDITTWVDETGGHIDLEGSDLDVLVGSNGETLDALQELTRLAVLRQSKRRVRLLLDINGFRARQRERLVSMVKATAEQVIQTREDHEFQPMSPAERKIVHDAVAAIDGAKTESLGEDPHRRVVIRPA
jgi:spoIIIJ-associated protein